MNANPANPAVAIDLVCSLRGDSWHLLLELDRVVVPDTTCRAATSKQNHRKIALVGDLGRRSTYENEQIILK